MTIYARGLGFSSTADTDAVDRDVTEGASIATHIFSWRTNRFDFEAFKSAVMQLLDGWAPRGIVGISPYPKYSTAEEVARTLVALVNIPEDALRSHSEREKKPSGSLYYGQAQAMHDLGSHTEKTNDEATRSRRRRN